MKARARSTRIRLDLGVCDKRQSQGQSNQIRQPAALVVWSTGAVTGARDVWDDFVVPYTRDVWSFEKLWVCTASIFPLKGAIPTILEKKPSLPSDSLRTTLEKAPSLPSYQILIVAILYGLTRRDHKDNNSRQPIVPIPLPTETRAIKTLWPDSTHPS